MAKKVKAEVVPVVEARFQMGLSDLVKVGVARRERELKTQLNDLRRHVKELKAERTKIMRRLEEQCQKRAEKKYLSALETAAEALSKVDLAYEARLCVSDMNCKDKSFRVTYGLVSDKDRRCRSFNPYGLDSLGRETRFDMVSSESAKADRWTEIGRELDKLSERVGAVLADLHNIDSDERQLTAKIVEDQLAMSPEGSALLKSVEEAHPLLLETSLTEAKVEEIGDDDE